MKKTKQQLKEALALTAHLWERKEYTADRAMADTMTGQVDELSVIKEAHGWRGEFNICGESDSVEIDTEAMQNAKNMDEAIVAADEWLKSYTG